MLCDKVVMAIGGCWSMLYDKVAMAIGGCWNTLCDIVKALSSYV